MLCVLISLATQAEEPQTSEMQSAQLISIDGEVISFADAKLRVYCMLGTECPVSRFYAVRLDEMAKHFAKDGVRFVGVHCNLHDSEADVRRFVKELGVSFPQVQDAKQAIARQLKATRVPEVFVIDAAGKIRYSGRIDDQYAPGVKRSAASTNALQSAITSVLSGKALIDSRVEPVGCLITFEKLAATAPTEITYCKTIAPMFNEHCVECH